MSCLGSALPDRLTQKALQKGFDDGGGRHDGEEGEGERDGPGGGAGPGVPAARRGVRQRRRVLLDPVRRPLLHHRHPATT